MADTAENNGRHWGIGIGRDLGMHVDVVSVSWRPMTLARVAPPRRDDYRVSGRQRS